MKNTKNKDFNCEISAKKKMIEYKNYTTNKIKWTKWWILYIMIYQAQFLLLEKKGYKYALNFVGFFYLWQQPTFSKDIKINA